MRGHSVGLAANGSSSVSRTRSGTCGATHVGAGAGGRKGGRERQRERQRERPTRRRDSEHRHSHSHTRFLRSGHGLLQPCSRLLLLYLDAPRRATSMLQSRARRGSLASSDGCAGSEDDADEGRTEGDLLFAQKCAELHGFVRPLLELLNGLKRGRYDRGLSSFQQSVAMDRIQRIVGVLQKPAMGERYLPTLLQVEAMLKLWFPHIAAPSRNPHPLPWPAAPTSARPPAPSGTRPGGERDQLRIPVKKRKLSWPDSESVTEPFTHNQSGRDEGTPGAEGATVSPGAPLSRSPQAGGGGVEGSGSLRTPVCPWSQAGLTWVHSTPICTPPQSCGGQAHEGGRGSSSSSPVAAVPPAASRGRPATQDSAVSSTTPPSCPRPPARCSSEPVAGETRRPGGGAGGGAPLGACQGRAQSLLVLFNPSGAAEERTAEHT